MLVFSDFKCENTIVSFISPVEANKINFQNLSINSQVKNCKKHAI